jgi:multicomponent Na+:H+ antiporter subunit A
VTVDVAIILTPFIFAALTPVLYRFISKKYIGWLVLSVSFILFLFLTTYIPRISDGEVVAFTHEWIPSLGIHFTTYLDGLSLIFSLLITGVGSLVILYSIFYLSRSEQLYHFYCYLLLFMGAMLGVVLSDNLMVLYGFWELTSVSSFLLIAYWHHRKASRAGARKSMIITVAGGISMLAGFLMLYEMSKTLSIREIIGNVEAIQEHALFVPALVLILLGAFTKSAQFPFYIWLPDAMEAPTPVSAYLHSATMVKAGIYLVARLTPVFGGEALWFWLVTGVGLFTLFWGSFNAVKQVDLKALLAFSTVSQLGLIMSLLGMGSVAVYLGNSSETIIYTQAAFAAIFHLINHSTFKGALFMMVGIIDHELGTRDIRRLGGLMSFMPLTFTIALIGSFSMAGLPPFNGFLSKEMFFAATLHIQELNIFSLDSIGFLIPIVAWIASVFTFVYCLIIVGKTFFGKVQLHLLAKHPHEAPIGMLISPYTLIVFVVGIFFFPNLLGHYILRPAMASIYPTFPTTQELTPHIHAWHGIFSPELWMTIFVIVVGILLYRLLKRWKPIYRALPQNLSLNSLFNNGISFSESFSNRVTGRYMTGNLTDYFVYIFLAFLMIVGGYFLQTDIFSWSPVDRESLEVFEIILVLIMIASSVGILFAKSRITTVFLSSVLGYSVAFFFIVFRAPDLALTQLVVESVSTVLYLICFRHLPEIRKEIQPKWIKMRNIFISLAVGATVTLVGFAALNYEKFITISYFFNDSYELAGGKNIVNTILGDFRAFDTMLEVVVLFIAGLGVYTLIKLKAKGGGTNEN